MRLGIALDLTQMHLEQVPELAIAVESAGLEVLLLRADLGRPYEALAAAASCANVAQGLHIGAQVSVGVAHPLYLAEERNVVDQLLGGRFVLTLEGREDVDELDEWAELLLQSGGTAPFTHSGRTFRSPAGLPENDINPEEKVRVTPAPFSLEPQLWLSGSRGAEAAAKHGVSVLVAEESRGTEEWETISTGSGRTTLRLRRPALRSWDCTAEDATELARRLAAEREVWGLDTALVRPAALPATDAWHHAVTELGRIVRPRVQLHRLPAGLEDFWDRERHSGVHTEDISEWTDHYEPIERR